MQQVMPGLHISYWDNKFRNSAALQYRLNRQLVLQRRCEGKTFVVISELYPWEVVMFAKSRFATVLSATLLCLSATQAMAADRPARIDETACEKPEFPARWQEDGETGGNVTVAYLVDTDGKVLQSKILESSGAVRVDRASVRAGARCKFQPGARDGQAAMAWAKVKYTWIVE